MKIDQKDFEKRWNVFLNIVGLDVQEALKKKLTDEHGRDTGQLKGSILYSAGITNTIVFSMDKHGEYVEYGTPPHILSKEEIEELEGWIKRKNPDWTDKKGKELTVEQKMLRLAEIIAKRGTKPYPFIRMTFHQDIKKIISEALKESFK